MSTLIRVKTETHVSHVNRPVRLKRSKPSREKPASGEVKGEQTDFLDYCEQLLLTMNSPPPSNTLCSYWIF